jgi:large subunit ribosomal protein L7/L12
MADLQVLAESLSQLNVLEAAELVKILEDKWGVKAAAGGGMMMPMMAMPGADAAPAVEEQTEFDVILASSGAEKIKVIKEVRAITSLGLKEAKDLVDNAPKPIKEKVSKEEADKIKKQMEAVGATIEIK